MKLAVRVSSRFKVNLAGLLSAAFLVLLVALSASPSRAAESSALSISAALDQVEFDRSAGISAEPNGTWIAFTVERNRSKRSGLVIKAPTDDFVMPGAEIRLVNSTSHEMITLGGTDFSAFSGRWSPDGRYLAYFSNQSGRLNLWVWEMSTRSSRQLSSVPAGGGPGQAPKWTPDSNLVIVPVVRETQTRENLNPNIDDNSRRLILKSDPGRRYGGSGTGAFVRDLGIIDLVTGSLRRLTTDQAVMDFTISFDGKYLAYTSLQPPARLGSQLQAALGSLSVQCIAPTDQCGAQTLVGDLDSADINPFVWSPTSNRLVVSSRIQKGSADEIAVFSENDKWRPITIYRKPRSSSTPGRLNACWSSDGSVIFASGAGRAVRLSPDGANRREIALPDELQVFAPIINQGTGSVGSPSDNDLLLGFQNRATKDSGFIRVDFHKAQWRYRLKSRIALSGRETDYGWQGERVIYLSSSPTSPQNLWAISPDSMAAPIRITNVSPDLENRVYGKPELVSWTTPKGLSRRGALLLPTNFKQGVRVPTIVYPYPLDNRSEGLYRFGGRGYGVENMQLFATRGFAVFLPDVAILGVPDAPKQTEVLSDIIVSGVEELVRLGIADPDHIGIMGQSFGGSAVFQLLASTTAFATGVARAGVVDTVSDYGRLYSGMPGYNMGAVRGEQMFGGTLWEKRETYLDSSPILNFDRVQAPLLIIHGTDDTNVSVTQSEQAFAALQRLGREVELAEYKGEDHVEEFWSYENQVDYIERVISWFEAHLKLAVAKIS